MQCRSSRVADSIGTCIQTSVQRFNRFMRAVCSRRCHAYLVHARGRQDTGSARVSRFEHLGPACAWQRRLWPTILMPYPACVVGASAMHNLSLGKMESHRKPRGLELLQALEPSTSLRIALPSNIAKASSSSPRTPYRHPGIALQQIQALCNSFCLECRLHEPSSSSPCASFSLSVMSQWFSGNHVEEECRGICGGNVLSLSEAGFHFRHAVDRWSVGQHLATNDRVHHIGSIRTASHSKSVSRRGRIPTGFLAR